MKTTSKERKGLKELAGAARAEKAGRTKKAAELHSKGDADLGIHGHYSVKNPKKHSDKLRYS